MELFTIIMQIRGAQGGTILIFNSEIAARAAAAKVEPTLSPKIVTVSDTYGRTISLNTAEIIAVTLNHVAEEQNGAHQMALMQARGQRKLQQLAERDPMLNGPQIVKPGQILTQQ